MASRGVQEALGLMQKNLECAICLELLKNPVSTKCDHQFCKFCITEFLQNKRSVPCPLCKKPVTKRALNDRPELGEIVENVRKLINAYQEDTGKIFSPPKGPDAASFFSCTPEPLPSKDTRGTKRKIRLSEPIKKLHDKRKTNRQTKCRREVDNGEEDLSNELEDDIERTDIFLPGENENDELLNYLENGSCGARTQSSDNSVHDTTVGQLDPLTKVNSSQKVTESLRRRTRSEDKNILKNCSDKDNFLHDSQSPLNVLHNGYHQNEDVTLFDNEKYDESRDAKVKEVHRQTKESGSNDSVRKKNISSAAIESDDITVSKGQTLELDSKLRIDSIGENKKCKRKDLGSEKLVADDNNYRVRNEKKNIGDKKAQSLDRDYRNEVQHKKSVEKLVAEVEGQEKVSRKLRARKNVKSMKELSDSFDENSDTCTPSNSQPLSASSDKLPDHEDLLNASVPKADKTYSRKVNEKDKNNTSKVKQWLQNIPASDKNKENLSELEIDELPETARDNEEISDKNNQELIDHDNEENLQQVTLQRKRIFKSTRNPSQQHHDMSISQCKGNLTFKLVNVDHANTMSQIPGVQKQNVYGKRKEKVKDFPFAVEESEQNVCSNKVNDDSNKHLLNQDGGQESDPYEFKSSQKTPTRKESKNKKSKLKKGQKKGQLHVKFIEKSKKGDENNPVEIIDNEEEDCDRNKNVEQVKHSVDHVNKFEFNQGGKCLKPAQNIPEVQSNGKKMSKTSKNKKSPTLLTQKDFDDLEKLKDKIDEAEDYDLLTSTQEASEKLCMDMENESLNDVIPDTENNERTITRSKIFENSSKPKKKVSFCNNVVKHSDELDETEKANTKVEQMQRTKCQEFDRNGKIKTTAVKILKKIDSPNPVTVIGETQIESQDSLSEPPSKPHTKSYSDKCTFKHPGDIVSSVRNDVKKIQPQKKVLSVNKDKVKTNESEIEEHNDAQARLSDCCPGKEVVEDSETPILPSDLCAGKKDTDAISDDIETCSSGTDDLSIDPSQEEFECPNLEIQPDDIKEQLSQDFKSQHNTGETTEYKTSTQNIKTNTNCANAELCVQETPQIQLNKDLPFSQSTNIYNGSEESEMFKKEQSKASANLTRKTRKSRKSACEDMSKSQSLTPVISVVKETPCVTMATRSVSMVTETQLSSTGTPETPIPSTCRVGTTKSVSSVSSSLETVMDESESIPSFVKNHISNKLNKDSKISNINETLTSGESIDFGTQQSVSMLILPNIDNRIEEDMNECDVTPSSLVSETTVKEMEDHVKQDLKEVRSEVEKQDSVLKTRRNKLKKRSKSPASSSIENTQRSAICEKNTASGISVDGKKETTENVNNVEKDIICIGSETDSQQRKGISDISKMTADVEYIPSTVGASREDTPIIQMVPHNSEKEAEMVPETIECSLKNVEKLEEIVTSREETPIIQMAPYNSEKKAEVRPETVECGTNKVEKSDEIVMDKHFEETERLDKEKFDENIEPENADGISSKEKHNVDVIDLDEDESVPEELTPTLVSLNTIKKLEKSNSKLKNSPEDIFLIDSETQGEDELMDTCTDIPQNPEGLDLFDTYSENTMKPSQSVDGMNINRDIKDEGVDDDYSVTMVTQIKSVQNEQIEKKSKPNSVTNVSPMKENIVSDCGIKSDKISESYVDEVINESQNIRVTRNSDRQNSNKPVITSDKVHQDSTSPEKKLENSNSENEAESELRKVKNKGKTRRGLASRMKKSSQKPGASPRLSLIVGSVPIEQTKKGESQELFENEDKDVSDKDQPISNSNAVISASSKRVTEKVSPTFTYSPRKAKCNSSIVGTPNSSQRSESGTKYPSKRNSLTFTRKGRRKSASERFENDQASFQLQDNLDKQESLSVIPNSCPEETVVPSQKSESQSNHTSSQKNCGKDDKNLIDKENELTVLSSDEDECQINSARTTKAGNKHTNDQDSGWQNSKGPKYSGQMSRDITSAKNKSETVVECSGICQTQDVSVTLTKLTYSEIQMMSSKKPISKRKRVQVIESDHSDEEFEASSPLPDMLGGDKGDNPKNEDTDIQSRLFLSDSSDEDEALLIKRKDELVQSQVERDGNCPGSSQPIDCDNDDMGTSHVVMESGDADDKNCNEEQDDSEDGSDEVIVRKRKIRGDDKSDVSDDEVIRKRKTRGDDKSDMSDDDDAIVRKRKTRGDDISDLSDDEVIERKRENKGDDESDMSEDEAVIRKGKNRSSMITDDSSSDEEGDSSQDSSHQMNLTSSSAFSSQSEAMTSQQKTDLEKDLERMRKQILELEAQLSAKKQAENTSLNRSKKLKSSGSSEVQSSGKKSLKRKKVKVRPISSDSSDEDEENVKGTLAVEEPDLFASSGKMKAIDEYTDDKSENDIHQYPSSGDESDELFLSPLPPSPPPSQMQINIQINLPEQIKETDEFLKQIIDKGQSSDNEPSSPILSQSKVSANNISNKDSSKSSLTLKANINSHNSSSLVKKIGHGESRHSSPLMTKMDLKNIQHSTPMRISKDGNNKDLKSPMFQNNQHTQVSTYRPVLSPIICNKEIKEERFEREQCFVASSLQIDELKEVQKLAVIGGCRFQTKFSSSVTHVIVKSKPFASRVCDRTLKFFQGLANKCWIIDYKWVLDSVEAGYLLPEDNYEIKGDTVTSENHNGPRRVRLSKKKLFQDFQIFIISTSEGLTPDHLSELFLTCGGSIVSDPDHFSGDMINLIITCADYDEDEDDERPTAEETKMFNRYYKEYRTVTVTREWVLDSLTLNTIQPIEDYMLTCVKDITIPNVRK